MKHILTLTISTLLAACNSGTVAPFPDTDTPTVETIITNGQVLTIERSANEYAAYGSVSIPRTKAGLAHAELLKKEVDALVGDLRNQDALDALH